MVVFVCFADAGVSVLYFLRKREECCLHVGSVPFKYIFIVSAVDALVCCAYAGVRVA